MLKRILSFRSEYHKGKEEAVESAVFEIEANTATLYFILFASIIAAAWVLAVFARGGMELIYERWEFYPFAVFFVASYFFIYCGSKLLVKPTAEEAEDDTSKFALFSACPRKEARALVSAGLSAVHTMMFALFLITKDMPDV